MLTSSVKLELLSLADVVEHQKEKKLFFSAACVLNLITEVSQFATLSEPSKLNSVEYLWSFHNSLKGIQPQFQTLPLFERNLSLSVLFHFKTDSRKRM